MKQRIEQADLEGLNDAQKDRLRELWEPEPGESFATFIASGWHLPKYDGSPVYHKSRIRENIVGACGGYWDCESVIDDGDDPAVIPDKTSLPLLSIGQIIRIVRRVKQMDIYTVDDQWVVQLFDLETCANDGRDCEWENSSRELCDALWQAVKEIL